jgi:tRNA (cmo5U34)-methyltransferase
MNVDHHEVTPERAKGRTEGAGAYFDEAAATWDDNPTRVELAQAVARGILAEVPLMADMVVMDFGCGTGLITRALAPEVASVVAADTSSEMLAVLDAKAKASGLNNVQPLPLEAGYPSPVGVHFDAIVSSMVFHHIEDIPALLARFAQWLRPGGWVAIADLEPEDGSFHRGNPHVIHHGIDPAHLGSELVTAGFSIQSVRTVHVVRRQPEGADQPRDYPVFLLVGRNVSPMSAT